MPKGIWSVNINVIKNTYHVILDADVAENTTRDYLKKNKTFKLIRSQIKLE